MSVRNTEMRRTNSRVRSSHGWFTEVFRAHTYRHTTPKQLARHLDWDVRTVYALLEGEQGRHIERAVELLASNPAMANECFARFGLGGLHYLDTDAVCEFELHAEISDLDTTFTSARADNVIDHNEWNRLLPKIASVAHKAPAVAAKRQRKVAA